MTDKLEVLGVGMLYCIVCTDTEDKKQIEEQTNIKVPKPFDRQWKVCSDLIMNGPEAISKAMKLDEFTPPPPMLCDLILHTHKHYILESYGADHIYKKSKINKVYKYTPKTIPKTVVPEAKKKKKRIPLRRRIINGVSFLENKKCGNTKLKLDTVLISKDEAKQRRKILKKQGNTVKIVTKKGISGLYIVLQP
jgi:hypothetical protein